MANSLPVNSVDVFPLMGSGIVTGLGLVAATGSGAEVAAVELTVLIGS